MSIGIGELLVIGAILCMLAGSFAVVVAVVFAAQKKR